MRRPGSPRQKNALPAAKSSVKTHRAAKVGDHLAEKAARHDAGVAALNRIFSFGGNISMSTPLRTKPESKRRKRKIAHESRRRNRL